MYIGTVVDSSCSPVDSPVRLMESLSIPLDYPDREVTPKGPAIDRAVMHPPRAEKTNQLIKAPWKRWLINEVFMAKH